MANMVDSNIFNCDHPTNEVWAKKIIESYERGYQSTMTRTDRVTLFTMVYLLWFTLFTCPSLQLRITDSRNGSKLRDAGHIAPHWLSIQDDIGAIHAVTRYLFRSSKGITIVLNGQGMPIIRYASQFTDGGG